ncbi:MAG: HAMP domain-containing protein [Spirochaetales bacterium]|nr:HAMP domain-containing protein [Spirochaetales bacterium]
MIEATERVAENRKVRYPLVVKLIGIISLIVVVSMLAITALATWFFAEDSRSRSEDSSLTLNQMTAMQMESEVRALHSGALSLMDTLREAGTNRLLATASVANWFERNAAVAALIVPQEHTIYNDKFFLANELEKETVQSFLAARSSDIERARAGEYLLVNASPFLGIPAAALLVPYRDLGTENLLVIVFSTENLQNIVRSDTLGRTYAVSQDGELIAHSDFSLVKLGVNMKGDPLVKQTLTSASDNMLVRYTEIDGKEAIGAYHTIAMGQFSVLSTMPLSIVYQAVFAVARQNILLTAIVLLLSILAVWFFSKTVSRPVMALVDASHKIEKGAYDLEIEATTQDELGLLTKSFAAMGRGLAERERIKETFGKFVNREIAEQALTGRLELGGVRRTATIFFSDIRSFTAISEKLAPEAVVEFLNEYMTRMVDCIEKTHGVVDKFIGDAIMGVWGAPVTQGSAAKDAYMAIQAMLMMRSALVDFNKGRGSADKPVIRIGCGLNTGPCLAGQIGSAQRMEYTVIGDAVNLASRIEALNKPFGTDILISENTLKLVADYVVVEPMPPIKVKGKEAPLQIYALINLKGHSGPQTLSDVRSLLGIVPPQKQVNPEEEEIKYEILKK